MFLKEPNRRNYLNWMKRENIRPMEKEHGGFRTEREKPKTDMSRIVKGMIERRMQRNRIYFTG